MPNLEQFQKPKPPTHIDKFGIPPVYAPHAKFEDLDIVGEKIVLITDPKILNRKKDELFAVAAKLANPAGLSPDEGNRLRSRKEELIKLLEVNNVDVQRFRTRS